MDHRLQDMLDHHEIVKTLKQYCFAADRCDRPRMESVYAKESWDDHGVYAAPGPEFANIMTREIAAQTDTLFHMLGQSQIIIEGDAAGAETYFFAVAQSTREDGVVMCNQLGGRFVDSLVREEGCWLIKHRTVVRDWAISLPIEADWTEHAGLARGHRSSADPGYAALAQRHSDVDGLVKDEARDEG